MRRDTDARLAWLAAAGLLAGAAAAWVVSRAGSGQHVIPNAPLALPAALLAGWSFIGSGLLSWQQGPVNRLGPVMVFTGFAWFVSWLPDAADPVLFTIGMALNAVYLVGFGVPVTIEPSAPLRRPVS